MHAEVMADEMASFRKLAKKVYDTMTQDISDVLTNEHVQLQDLVKERSERYRDKMTRSMDEIFAILPDFDFDRYYNENGYLDKIFPVVEAEVVDPDEEEAQIRQEAFHRFQWLRSEGDRLGEENSRLQKRLNELKRKQKQELMRAQEIEQEAEQRRLQLQNAEYDLEEQIEELNKSIEQSMVEQEQFITEKTQPKPRPRKLPAKKKLPSRTSESKPEWNVGAAQDLEEKTAEVTAHAETSRIAMTTATSGVSQKDGRSKLSQTIAAAKKKSRSRVQQPQGQQEKDPFHFSPIKTPPREPPRQKEISPFHFSPPKSPRQVALPAADASEPQATTSRQPQARRYDPSRTDYQIGRAQMQSANFW